MTFISYYFLGVCELIASDFCFLYTFFMSLKEDKYQGSWKTIVLRVYQQIRVLQIGLNFVKHKHLLITDIISDIILTENFLLIEADAIMFFIYLYIRIINCS